MKKYSLILATCVGLGATGAMAQTVSPTSGGTLPAAVSRIGGIVLDMIGLNGNRVVAQLAASTLYEGFNDTEPQPIGTQTGFTASVISQLGGGLRELAVRVTLYDGDSSAGDFDGGPGENVLILNGVEIGAFDAVSTVVTDSVGTAVGSATGFSDNLLATGFFFTEDTTELAALYASIEASGSVQYALSDVDPGDNYFDFTRGLDGSVIDIGTGPIVTPPPSAVPLPAAATLLMGALAGLGLVRRRRA